MKTKIGIDPGVSGAIAIVSDDGVELFDMPTAPKSSGKGKEVNCGSLVPILYDHRGLLMYGPNAPMVYLEKVHARPRQGVTSMFSFGRSLGVVEGVLAALEIPYTFVNPQKWKRLAGLQGKPKDYSRTVASKLYPEVAKELTRKKDVGRADALLIAHFGSQI